jgi:hypothetical protein
VLRLVYRSYGGENMKGRPAFYSKALALASFVRAARASGADVVFLNDGPVPGDRLALMEGNGDVVALPDGPVGMRSSYRAALDVPAQRRWPGEDIVYFCEDDYLHQHDAFIGLQHAGTDLPQASYFALYASTPRHPAFGPGAPFVAPKGWKPAAPATVGDRAWVNVPSTASTFGARVSAIGSDMGIFRQGMVPYRTRLLDHETCLVYQGHVPYPLAEVVLGPPATRFRSGLPAVAVNAVLSPFRIAFDARALTRRRTPHLLYAADPNLACHLESAFMSPGTDWALVARQTAEWAGDHGYVLPEADPH